MGSDKSKKKTTLDWILIVAIIVAVVIGGYFLYQKVIKYMISPEKPPTGEFIVVTPPGGQPTLVPKPPGGNFPFSNLYGLTQATEGLS